MPTRACRGYLLRPTAAGLFCEKGGFHIDPTSPVAKAIVTHAHGDHATRGHAAYISSRSGERLVRHRVGENASITGWEFCQQHRLGEVLVSLHPAGHILGSAQVRIEWPCPSGGSEVWVVTGDFRRDLDPTCEPFEVVPCNTLVTEATFARPQFVWPSANGELEKLKAWWRENQSRGCASFLYAYALGKAQRILAALDPADGPIFAPRVVREISQLYRDGGVVLPKELDPRTDMTPELWGRALIIQPPSGRYRQMFPSAGTSVTAFASGWMLDPEELVKRQVEAGFVISDHPDHREILATIEECGAKRVFATHGETAWLCETLNEQGIEAHDLESLRVARGARPEASWWEVATGPQQ
ncbi:MAG: DNA ligase-associated DEXH box helicase [Planctomyces sp.]|nr:DNA ligase-associated DEXH box helicase [Planctomyces sp.]